MCLALPSAQRRLLFLLRKSRLAWSRLGHCRHCRPVLHLVPAPAQASWSTAKGQPSHSSLSTVKSARAALSPTTRHLAAITGSCTRSSCLPGMRWTRLATSTSMMKLSRSTAISLPASGPARSASRSFAATRRQRQPTCLRKATRSAPTSSVAASPISTSATNTIRTCSLTASR